ncbi:MAG: hypothetical protein MHMPM18_003526, partial [Marteilia pararefringens]
MEFWRGILFLKKKSSEQFRRNSSSHTFLLPIRQNTRCLSRLRVLYEKFRFDNIDNMRLLLCRKWYLFESYRNGMAIYCIALLLNITLLGFYLNIDSKTITVANSLSRILTSAVILLIGSIGDKYGPTRVKYVTATTFLICFAINSALFFVLNFQKEKLANFDCYLVFFEGRSALDDRQVGTN